MQGFGFATIADRTSIPLLPSCGKCQLDKGCKSPKMPASGKGKRRILILGEAPGETEDEQGKPFIGKAGQRLRQAMERAGIDVDRDAWITNSLICRPPRNATPTDKEIEWCRPNLWRTLREVDPDVIILLGKSAMRSMLAPIWGSDVGAVERWVGWRIPCRKPNAWICPTWHPSYLLRMNDPVLDMHFENHLKVAVGLEGKPWAGENPDDPTPDMPYENVVVEKIFGAEEAAEAIRVMTRDGRPTAFDYECDRIKPDHKEAFIYSCALSNGKRTISYPWLGEAAKATEEFLRSDVPKIAQNAKYEQRWTRARLGFWPRHIVWDTMIAAHVLDSRSSICALDFQAFIHFGLPPWDGGVGQFLRAKTKGGNEPNRIKEADLSQLLTYGGVDALVEWKLAMKQAKAMGVKL